MQYFWETSGSIPKGVGFDHYSPCHILWLLAFLTLAISVSLLYRRADPTRRKHLRFLVAALILLDEAAKWIILLATGLWNVEYLPLHLCTINIFLIAIHIWKPSPMLDNFLYTICIPAALIALLFPSWNKLPPANFMHIHSFTIHILLALYPIMLNVGGDIRPSAKQIPKCILLLVGLAIPAYVVNKTLGTNYMFLMRADAGNPLRLFEKALGSHLYGFPILLPVLLLLFYLPWTVARAIQNHRRKPRA